MKVEYGVEIAARKKLGYEGRLQRANAVLEDSAKLVDEHSAEATQSRRPSAL